jgi:hypothetical protein
MARSETARVAERIRELIEEGKSVASLERRSPYTSIEYIQDKDKIQLQAWLSKTMNIVEATFGPESPQFRHMRELMPKGPYHIGHSYEVYPIVGMLTGARDDLEKGFLRNQGILISGDVFDSVLERATELNRLAYKDPSAVLVRVVLEGALRRLSAARGIDTDQTASQLNDALREAGFYAKPQWRLVQAWLDIGNAAAHGKFNDYSQEAVSNAIEGVTQFLALYFGPDRSAAA